MRRDERRPGGADREHSAERSLPPEAYAFFDEVSKDTVEAIQRRADSELAGDELVLIEGDGDDT